MKFNISRTIKSYCLFGLIMFMLLCQFCKNKKKSYLNINAVDPKKTEIKYASGFDIEDHGSFKILRVYNPWQRLEGKSITYLLNSRDAAIPESIQVDIKIDVPVCRVICTSTTHIAMIGALDKMETIRGISGKQYITNNFILDKINGGKIKDVGYEQNLNYELILSLKPDLIIMYGVTGEVTGVINRLTSLGIPVILDGEYLETTPLAKMEWIKFIACLYDELEAATKIFHKAESEYNELKKLTDGIVTKPEVLSGLPWNNTWWIPGGKSFAATFIKDAGGIYIWEEDTSREALPLDMEIVYDYASHADVWINTGYANTLSEILNTDQRLQYFKPYMEKMVYNNNARLNSTGGNDYWESGVINPHIILKDLIHIFHPAIIPDHQLVYYQKLE